MYDSENYNNFENREIAYSSAQIALSYTISGLVLFWGHFFQLRYYKNKVEQKPGWNINLLKWCLQEAQSNKLNSQDYMGGLVLDEMKIQVLCSTFTPKNNQYMYFA